MKKQLLLISMAVSVGLTVNAQSNKRVSAQSNVLQPKVSTEGVAVKIVKGEGKVFGASSASKGSKAASKSNARTSSAVDNPSSVAQTTYELHANTGIVKYGSNKYAVAVTGSQADLNATTGTWPDRGSYTNYIDLSAANPAWGPAPTTRIESIRTGWPVIAVTKTGKEVVVAHDANTGFLVVSTRATVGTGAFTTTTNVLRGTWPRVAVGGPNGETIHVIAADQDNNNFTVYHRSLDGGATWDIIDQVLPGINSANGYELLSGNDYAIDAKGNTLAIVSGGSFTTTALWKSTDNGSTMSRQVIWTFPIPNYNPKGMITDVNGDAVADTLENTDGYMEVILDKNNKAHWFAGYGRILDENSASTDSGFFYFPGLNGLLYWSENVPSDSIRIIVGAPDVNGNGSLDYTSFPTYNGPTLASMATAAVDTVNGTLLVALSCPTEGDTTSDGTVFRDIYYTTSTDGGTTWVELDTIARVTRIEGEEDVYPAMVERFTDNSVVSNWACFPAAIAWQRGFEPGSVFSNPPLNIEANDYMVLLPCNELTTGVSYAKDGKDFIVSDNYPNPFSDVTTITVNVARSADLTLSVYNVVGQKVYESKQNGVSGAHNFKVSKADLGTGMFFYTVSKGDNFATGKMIVK